MARGHLLIGTSVIAGALSAIMLMSAPTGSSGGKPVAARPSSSENPHEASSLMARQQMVFDEAMKVAEERYRDPDAESKTNISNVEEAKRRLGLR